MSLHAHAGEWHRFIIEADDFYVAARLAARHGFWLHCWDWREAPIAEPRIIDLWDAKNEVT